MRRFLLFFFRRWSLLNKLHRNLPKTYGYLETKDKYSTIHDLEVEQVTLSVILEDRIELELHEVTNPETNIYHLTDIHVFVENGSIMDSTKKLYLNTYMGKDPIHYKFFYNLDFLKAPYRIAEGTFVHAPTNYWHFHVEFLARVIHLLSNYENLFVYTNKFQNQWQRDVIELYKIKTDRIIEIDSPYLSFEKYVFCDFLGTKYLGFNSRLSTRILKTVVNKIVLIKPLTRRIYISRNKAKSRKICNELALFEVLLQYGFEYIELEEYNAESQYNLFSESSVIFAQHGACLTNMLAVSGATVIELFNSDWPMNMYALMALETNNFYYRIYNEEFNGNNPQSADYIVDIHQIESLFEQINIGKLK